MLEKCHPMADKNFRMLFVSQKTDIPDCTITLKHELYRNIDFSNFRNSVHLSYTKNHIYQSIRAANRRRWNSMFATVHVVEDSRFWITWVCQWNLQPCDGKGVDTVLHGAEAIFSLASSCQEMCGGENMWTVITFREGSWVTGHPTPLRQLQACTLRITVSLSELLVTANVPKVVSCLWLESHPA
jgi:hypothetical protein